MIFPLMAGTAFIALSWPIFWSVIIFLLLPKLAVWKNIVLSGASAVIAVTAALWWLIHTAIAEGEERRALGLPPLQGAEAASQDAYGYFAVWLIFLIIVSLVIGLPICAVWLKRLHGAGQG